MPCEFCLHGSASGDWGREGGSKCEREARMGGEQKLSTESPLIRHLPLTSLPESKAALSVLFTENISGMLIVLKQHDW